MPGGASQEDQRLSYVASPEPTTSVPILRAVVSLKEKRATTLPY